MTERQDVTEYGLRRLLIIVGVMAAALMQSLDTTTMQYVLTEGERNYWFADRAIDVMSLLCVTSMGAFVWWELWKADLPIVDLQIFRNRSVLSGSIIALALGGVSLGSTYVLPQLTQGPPPCDPNRDRHAVCHSGRCISGCAVAPRWRFRRHGDRHVGAGRGHDDRNGLLAIWAAAHVGRDCQCADVRTALRRGLRRDELKRRSESGCHDQPCDPAGRIGLRSSTC
jgi:hypothetical protein